MKSLLLKSMALMTAFAMTLSLSSCGDDNDEPQAPSTPSTPAVTDYVLTSKIKVHQDMLTYFDVNVTYIASNGEVKTTTLESTDFDHNDRFAPANLPADLVLKAVATPKSTYPAIEPDKVYHFLQYEYLIALNGYDSNGTRLSQMGKSDSKNLPTNGVHLQEALTNGREIKICDYSAPIKK